MSIAETDTSKPVSAFPLSISVRRTHVKFMILFGTDENFLHLKDFLFDQRHVGNDPYSLLL